MPSDFWTGLVVPAILLACFIGYMAFSQKWATLAAVGLSARIKGLVMFGLDGAHLSLWSRRYRDCVRVTRRSEAGQELHFELLVDSKNMTTTKRDTIRRNLRLLQPRVDVESEESSDGERKWSLLLGGTEISNDKTLEGVVLAVIKELGHRNRTLYRIEYEGPTDWEAVRRAKESLYRSWKSGR